MGPGDKGQVLEIYFWGIWTQLSKGEYQEFLLLKYFYFPVEKNGVISLNYSDITVKYHCNYGKITSCNLVSIKVNIIIFTVILQCNFTVVTVKYHCNFADISP